MNATPITLDPEVQAILHEVAAEPGSVLLRQPTSDVFFSPHARLRSTTPSLKAAERELVQVHREELAYWLRAACLRRILTNSDSTVSLTRHLPDRQVLSIPDRDAIASTLERVPAVESPPAGYEDALSSLVREESCSASMILEALALSSRLVPCDSTRVYAAVCLTELRQVRAARAVLRTVLAQSVDPLIIGICWNNLGTTFFAERSHEEAAKCYRRAVNVQGDYPAALFGWLLSSLLVGDQESASEAAVALDRSIEPTDPSVQQFVHGEFPLLVSDLESTRRIAKRMGATSRSITSV